MDENVLLLPASIRRSIAESALLEMVMNLRSSYNLDFDDLDRALTLVLAEVRHCEIQTITDQLIKEKLGNPQAQDTTEEPDYAKGVMLASKDNIPTKEG